MRIISIRHLPIVYIFPSVYGSLVDADYMTLILQIIDGVRVIGDSLAQIVVSVIGDFTGFEIPLLSVNLLMIVIIVFALLKVRSTISKLILFVLVFLLLANGLSMFSIPW